MVSCASIQTCTMTIKVLDKSRNLWYNRDSQG
nr:MAG TPA: hypothetical protein [Caudoviricetes sp.]